MEIQVFTIPYSEQRYDTVGDWQFEGEKLIVRVAKMGDWRKEMLVAVHEIHEALLALNAGISEEAVDRFDMEFERRRRNGDESEPGDDPHCPVHKQHVFATSLERLFCAELGLDWQEYDKVVRDL